MANRTIHREVGRLVIWICRGVVVLGVARSAISRRAAVLASDVTLHALQSRMHTRQSEASESRVIELRRRPVGGRVAHGAVSWEIGLHVIRVGRAVVVFRVAPKTCNRRALRKAIHMAGTAVDRRVHAGQREASELRMIECRAEPRIHAMA